MSKTIQEQIADEMAEFAKLTPAQQRKVERDADAYIRKYPHAADNNGFWRGLSARHIGEAVALTRRNRAMPKPSHAAYAITCRSGIVAVVNATSIDDANAAWDSDVAAGKAEPRIPNLTAKATARQVHRAVETGHDYR
jgi:hypothetical protein